MDLTENLTKPDFFLSQINTLKEKLPAILDDFKKIFIFYNKTPESSEYQQMFENIKHNLQKVNSELFMTTNNIEKDTEYINKKLHKLDVLIKQEKIKNKKFKKKLGIIEKEYNGSDELIDDYKEIYNLYYLTNFALFIGIILFGLIMSKVFSSKTPTI
jgi:hypothetical protein